MRAGRNWRNVQRGSTFALKRNESQLQHGCREEGLRAVLVSEKDAEKATSNQQFLTIGTVTLLELFQTFFSTFLLVS